MRIDADPRALPLLPVCRLELKRLLGRILDALDLDGADFTLRVVDDREIAHLNETFLGCVGPTNVLSFPAEEMGEGHGDPGDVAGAAGPRTASGSGDCPRGLSLEPDAEVPDAAYLGDIALSAETLLREADLYGQDPAEHLARLLAHALLHLAGFDHGEAMDELTERAVQAAGRP